MRRFRQLAVATTASAFLLIVWGGIVRTTGSGDGCPDWPTCFGSWIPRAEFHTIVEYVHRLLAAISGTLLVILALTGIWLKVRAGTGASIPPRVVWATVGLVPLFFLQALLGGIVVNSGLDPAWVTAHFAVAMLVLGALVTISGWSIMAERGIRLDRDDRRTSLALPATVTAVSTFALLLVGTYVRAEGAALAFRDWPLMDGTLIPSFEKHGALEMFAHRFLALTVGLLLSWTAIRAWTTSPRSRPLVRLASLALAFFGTQVVVGALTVWTGLETWTRAGHVGLSAATWGAVVALALVAWETPAAEPVEALEEPPSRPSLAETTRAYFRLTKPRIIVLLLITTVPAMILAEEGIPPPWLILATLVGGALAAGSANSINMYLDRDIDEVMHRTRQRPLPSHEVAPESALRLGFFLGALSFLLLATVVNLLAAALAMAAIAFYVFVYTMWLKRSTTQNIVIGGAAGAAPVLVGWAAVTGGLALPAWILFAIIFAWTPPHFWALAMRYSKDYAAAGVPMLPVVRGERETRRQILLYSLILFAVTLLLVPAANMGPVYVVTAVVLGGVFLYRALLLWQRGDDGRSWALFAYSTVYLAALFAAVAVDALASV